MIDTGHYYSALETHHERLQEDAGRLFLDESQVDDIDLPVWDAVLPSQTVRSAQSPHALDKWRIVDEADLKDFLSDMSTLTVASSPPYTGELATRPDPKCRYIFPYPVHARASLSMTKSMLCRILSYYQVMPTYLDLLTTFGLDHRARDLRYGGFRGKARLSTSPRPGTVAPGMGRSGWHIQMCYNLKSVTCTTPPKTARRDMQWYREPVALYHHFDVVNGNALWVITSGGRCFRDRLEDTVGEPGRAEDRDYTTLEACFRSTFSVHAVATHWMKEGWPIYMQWLEEVVEDSTSDVIYGIMDKLLGTERLLENIQNVQFYEDKTKEAIMALESNVEVLAALVKYYEDLLVIDAFPLRQSGRADITRFTCHIQDVVNDTKIPISRANLILRIAADRKALMMQSYSADQANAVPKQTPQKTEVITSTIPPDATKIITHMALMYLLVVFVFTLFSTDISGHQNRTSSD